MRFIALLTSSFVMLATPAFASSSAPQPADHSRSTASASRGRLGIQVLELTPELRLFYGAPTDAGVLVSKVAANGSAAQAGVRIGDVLIAIDRSRIAATADVLDAIAGRSSAAAVTFVVVRNERVHALRGRLDGAPHELDSSAPEPSEPRIGSHGWSKSWRWQWSWPDEQRRAKRKKHPRRR
jgi:S1-C subfamily serine protease